MEYSLDTGWEVRLPTKKATVTPEVKLLGMRNVGTKVSLNQWHRSEELFPVAFRCRTIYWFLFKGRVCVSGFYKFSFVFLLSFLSFVVIVLLLSSILAFVC